MPPARCAGRSIARRSSTSRIGPTSTSLPVISSASSGNDEHNGRGGRRGWRATTTRSGAAASATTWSTNSICSSAIAAGHEQLLELVDEHEAGVQPTAVAPAVHRRARLGDLRRRGVTMTDVQPPGTGSTPAASAGSSAGPHERRLAAARRADDGEQTGSRQPGDELGDETLAPEEVGGVVRPRTRPGPCTGRARRAHVGCPTVSADRGAMLARRCSSTCWMPSTLWAISARSPASRACAAAERSAAAPTSRRAARSAHSLASSCTRNGLPPVSSWSRSMSSVHQPLGRHTSRRPVAARHDRARAAPGELPTSACPGTAGRDPSASARNVATTSSARRSDQPARSASTSMVSASARCTSSMASSTGRPRTPSRAPASPLVRARPTARRRGRPTSRRSSRAPGRGGRGPRGRHRRSGRTAPRHRRAAPHGPARPPGASCRCPRVRAPRRNRLDRRRHRATPPGATPARRRARRTPARPISSGRRQPERGAGLPGAGRGRGPDRGSPPRARAAPDPARSPAVR